MGFALLYQSFSVVTALYFRKRLATAYAIGRSGMGLTFALAPFTQLLLDQYAWQGRRGLLLYLHHYISIIFSGTFNQSTCQKGNINQHFFDFCTLSSIEKKVICIIEGPELYLSSTGAMLILGGLMLNLVASGMLLRPINVKPPLSNPTSSPIQKSPAISIKSSSEKEYTKSCLNGSSHLSNGISKSDSFPSPPSPPSPPPPPPPAPQADTENLEGQSTQGRQDQSENPELTRLVLNGVNGHEPHHDVGQCKPTLADSSAGSMNGSTIVGFPSHASTPSEVVVRQTKVLDFSLLKDPFFCIYTWSLVFSQLAYFIPYFHLSARARTLGIDAMDASFIISVAGECTHDPFTEGLS